MTREEWGPWIEHDGAGTPAAIRVGDRVEVDLQRNDTGELLRRSVVITPRHLDREQWTWGVTDGDILRYRIRTPRALTQLRAIAAAPERDEVPA